jgi:nucleoside-diphosphate-sugar epimerase
MRVLIVGCGYVGLPLGAELARLRYEVFGLRRTGVGCDLVQAAGIRPVQADITQPDTLRQLPSPFDWVVNCVASGKGDAADYRAVYHQGTRHLIDWLAPTPPAKFVYTSSTSVYAQDDGSAVKETSPTEPTSETSQILVQTEQLLRDAAEQRKFPAVILRVAGIYGPDRGHLFRQFLKGETKIAGHGERLINMIHRDDLVTIVIAALKHGRPGEIYNAVDDEPVAQVHFYRWLSETLGRSMPPFDPTGETADRKRGLTNKRVQNRRLKMELGYQFKYPTFRQGYTAEIQRLQNADQLDLQPEPLEGGAA